MAILPKVCQPDTFVSCNPLNLALPVFEIFVRITFDVNLSLNENLIFLLYMGQS